MDVTLVRDSQMGVLRKGILLEGPLWTNDQLHYIDIVGDKIHRHNFTSGQHDVVSTGAPVGFAVLDDEGKIIAGIGNGELCRLSFGSTEKELLARYNGGNSNNLANDGKCDRRGRLWLGTKNRDETAPDSGSLYRLDPGAKPVEIVHPVHISNGIAWSPDNKTMYYNDSTSAIWAFDYDIETGHASKRRVLVNLPADGSVPDGMTVDSAGNLYCAMWGGSRVDVYAPNGKHREVIPVQSALQVSSVAFGGTDLKTLYITTAACDLSPDQQIGRAHV